VEQCFPDVKLPCVPSAGDTPEPVRVSAARATSWLASSLREELIPITRQPILQKGSRRIVGWVEGMLGLDCVRGDDAMPRTLTWNKAGVSPIGTLCRFNCVGDVFRL
jgi:hypothetical protein